MATLEDFAAGNHYVGARPLPDGRWAAVMTLWPGDRGRIVAGRLRGLGRGYEDGW